MDQKEFKSLMSDYLDIEDMERLFSDDIKPKMLKAPLNNYFGDDFLTLLSRNTDLLPDRLAALKENLLVVGDTGRSNKNRATAAVAIGRYARNRGSTTRGRFVNESASKQWFALAAELESVLGAWELANDHLSDANLVIKVDREHDLMPQVGYKEKSSSSFHATPNEPATRAWALGVRLILRQEKTGFRGLSVETLEAGLWCIVNWLTLLAERERYAYRQAVASRLQSLDWIDPLWKKLIQKIDRRSAPELKQRLLDQQLAINLFLSNESHASAEIARKELKPRARQSDEQTESDHIVVIPGTIPPAPERGDNALLELYKGLQQPVALTHLPHLDQLHALRETLEAEFPWATEAIRVVTGALIARRQHGSVRLGMPPILLAGEPGTGKTRFAQRLSELLGTPNTVINMAGMRDVNLLKGVSRGWASNRPSRIIEFIQQTNVANPLFILDEVDKAEVGTHDNGNPYNVLLDLLEPGNARRYTDMYLMAECDLSHCLYVLTCNSLRALPEPLLSRVRMVFFPAPREEHAHIITQGICRDMERAWSIPAGALSLSAAESANLAGLKPREMKRALLDLFGRNANTTVDSVH